MRKAGLSKALSTALWPCFLIIAFGFAHWHTPSCSFLSDDFYAVTQTHSPSPRHILSLWLLDRGDPFFYRPLSMMMVLVDGQLWGFQPTGFHVSNLLLHLANSLLAYCLGVLLLGNHRGAMSTAAFFLLFPLQPEVVTWVAGRSGLLTTFFYLSSMVLYVKCRRTQQSLPFFLAIACGMLAILSKEDALSFPLMLLVIEFVFFRDRAGEQSPNFRPALFLLVLIIPLYFGIRLFLLGDTLSIILHRLKGPMPEVSPFLLLTGLVFHVLKNVSLRPLLVIMNPFHGTLAKPEWLPYLYGMTGLCFLFIGLRVGTWRNRVAVFSTLGFVVSLLPVSLFFNVAPGSNLQSARLLYLTSVFVSLFLANLAFGRSRRLPGTRGEIVRSAFVLVLCLLMTIGLKQNNGPWVEASRIQRQIVAEFQRISRGIPPSCRIFIQGLPSDVHGAFVFPFGIGAAQALNLSTGSLPPYRYAPEMNKLAYEFHYMTEVLPFKIVTPEFLHSWAWEFAQEVLANQQVDIPSWMTDNPDNYDIHLRWDPSLGTFRVQNNLSG
jgi:hypothetical protein